MDGARLRLQQDADALGLERPLQESRTFGIELALHQPVHQVDERDRHAGARQAVGRLDAEQSAADHDGGHALCGCGGQVGDVGEGAERRHAGKGSAGQREPNRLGACRQNARIEWQGLAVTQHDLACGGVERDGRLARPQRNAVLGVPGARPHLHVIGADFARQQRG